MYVRIALLNLFFNAHRTCCCRRRCLEVKTTSDTRAHPRICTVYYYGAPLRNSTKTGKAREPYETAFWYGFFMRCIVEKDGVVGFSLQRVEPHRRKNVQRGTAPNRTVGYITEPNSTVGFHVFQNRNKPHREISAFLKPHRSGP